MFYHFFHRSLGVPRGFGTIGVFAIILFGWDNKNKIETDHNDHNGEPDWAKKSESEGATRGQLDFSSFPNQPTEAPLTQGYLQQYVGKKNVILVFLLL